MLSEGPTDNTPDFYPTIWINGNDRTSTFGCHYPARRSTLDAFAAEATIDNGDDNITVPGVYPAIYSDQIAVHDSRIDHRTANHPHEEGRGRALDHQSSEVQAVLGMVGGR